MLYVYFRSWRVLFAASLASGVTSFFSLLARVLEGGREGVAGGRGMFFLYMYFALEEGEGKWE